MTEIMDPKKKSLSELTELAKKRYTYSALSWLDYIDIVAYISNSGRYREEYKTFDEYLDEEWGSLGRSTIYKHLKIHDIYFDALNKYIGKNNEALLPLERLYQAREVAEDDPDGWLHNAMEMTPKDFKTHIQKAKDGNDDYQVCTHKEITLLCRCTECNDIFSDPARVEDYIEKR